MKEKIGKMQKFWLIGFCCLFVWSQHFRDIHFLCLQLSDTKSVTFKQCFFYVNYHFFLISFFLIAANIYF